MTKRKGKESSAWSFSSEQNNTSGESTLRRTFVLYPRFREAILIGDLVDRFNFMAGLFFSPMSPPAESGGTSAIGMVSCVGTRADREGDSTIRKHAPIRLKSSVARNYCPKLYVLPCWLRRHERAILCYHENRTSPPRPPVLPPHDGSFVRATLQSNEHVTR